MPKSHVVKECSGSIFMSILTKSCRIWRWIIFVPSSSWPSAIMTIGQEIRWSTHWLLTQCNRIFIEANSFSASQEISRFLCNPQISYRVQNSRPLIPVMSQSSLVYTYSYLLKINFSIVPPSSPKSSKWNLSLRFPSPKPFLHLSCPSYVPCVPPDPFSFSLDHPDNIFFSTLFSNILNLSFSLNMRHQVWHPHKTTDKIIVLYILISIVFDSRLEHNIFCTEW